MKLSELSTFNEEKNIYDNVDADHVYEIPVLDEHNQIYEEVQAPSPNPESSQLQPLSSAGDFEFTQCPAYVSVGAISIRGNQTSK